MKNSNTPLSPTFFLGDAVVMFDASRLAFLKSEAQKAPLRRSRYCLHQDHSDNIQQMVIAFCQDTYIRPHRHIQKTESFHIIEGELWVILLDDDGRIIDQIEMGPADSKKTFIYRLSTNTWHTVIPKTDYVVVHEISQGPFVRDVANFLPASPRDEEPEAGLIFLRNLLHNNLKK